MYKTISLLFAVISFSFNSLAQSPDDILGVWTNSSKTEIIEIYKVSSKYIAKITTAKDKNWIGKKVIWDLNYDSKKKGME